jgi:hypothetical protein
VISYSYSKYLSNKIGRTEEKWIPCGISVKISEDRREAQAQLTICRQYRKVMYAIYVKEA